MNPLVSISCVTFNHAKYICECLDSMLSQKTNFNFEIIIHDDASTDGTKEIIEEYVTKYPEIIFPIFQTENQFSKGIRGIPTRYNYVRCRGKYIAICDGDDYWIDPQKLQKQIDFLELNPDFSICFHNMKIKDELNPSILKFTNKNQKEISEIEDLAKGNYIYSASTVFRKPPNGYPDWLLEMPIGDYPLHLINAQYGKIKYIDEVMGVYRIHEGGIWGPYSKLALNQKWIQTIELMQHKFTVEVNEALKKQIMESLFECYYLYYQNNEKEKSLDSLEKLIKLNPFLLADKLLQSEKKLDKILTSKSYKIGTNLINFIKKYKISGKRK